MESASSSASSAIQFGDNGTPANQQTFGLMMAVAGVVGLILGFVLAKAMGK